MDRRYLRAINEGREELFYKSWAWQKKRRTILERDNYECQRCKSLGQVSKGVVVHHIKELKDYPKLGMTDDNLTTVCFRCHNIIHERFEGRESKIEKDFPERW